MYESRYNAVQTGVSEDARARGTALFQYHKILEERSMRTDAANCPGRRGYAPAARGAARIMLIQPRPSHTAGFGLLLCSEPRHHADGKSMGRIDRKDAVARKQ